MSLSFPAAGYCSPLLEIQSKEKKPRYSMAALQVRWPMRTSRPTNGSPTSKKSKGTATKKRKSESADSPKSKSTDSIAISTSTNLQCNKIDKLAADAQLLPLHPALNSTLAWSQKQDSPKFPDANELEIVQFPQEISPRALPPERQTRILNSMQGERRSPNMHPAGSSCPITADQRQDRCPRLAQGSELSPPPIHPGRSRPYRKAPNADIPQEVSAKATTENVSPILGLVLQKKAIQATPGYIQSLAPSTVVSPLSIDMPQPQRAFVPPSFDKLIQVETDPLLDQSGKSGNSTTSSELGRSVSAPNSPASSRSSIYSDDFPQKSVADGCSRHNKAYSLISPVTAGVFDDNTGLKRNPTFKNKISLRKLRNKPLPPEPVIEITPQSIQRTVGQEPMGNASHCGRLIQPTSKPVFLPRDPRPSDLDILDEAFRRSGFYHVAPSKHAKSKSGRASGSSTISSSPSLRMATFELEEQLSALSRSTRNNTSWLKIGWNRSSPLEFPADCAPKPLKPRSHRTKLGPHSSVSPTKKASSPKKRNDHSSFSFPAKKSWSAKKKVKVTPTISELVEAVDKHQPLPSPLPQVCANDDNLDYSMSPSNNSSDDAKPTETVNRVATLRKGRGENVERNLRLSLPRLRTQLSAKSIRGPVNLSAVVESPTDQENQPDINNETSPKERIMAVLNRLDPEQPESPHNTCSCHNKNNEVFEFEDSELSSASERVGSKDMLCEPFPSEIAKSVIYQIMQKIDNLEDLFNLSVINKAFYSVFREHSLTLIKDTLFRMSPAAWELREICPPWETEGDETGDIDMPVPEYTPNLYINHYTRDLYTMVALKSLILVRCESFLRPDTARALAGLDETRCLEVDEAFWRVWTFCKLFGCGKGREDDITAQVDWLSGGRLAEEENRGTNILMQYPAGVHSVLFNAPSAFSKGNHGGLSSTELYDMMEIWTCLGVLLQVFHGKCKVARHFGVFDGLKVTSGDVVKEESLIESWTQYLLTLGPSAILTLTSINPDAPIETLFSRAQANGWTKWKAPDSSNGGAPRLFLKEAVSQVYESRLASMQTPVSSRTPKPNSPPPHSPSPITRHRGHSREISSSSSGSLSPQFSNPNRRRQAGFAAELRRKRKESYGSDMSVSADITSAVTDFKEERPISHFSTVIENLDRSNRKCHRDLSPAPPLPTTIPSPINTTLQMTQRITSSTQNFTASTDAILTKKSLLGPVPTSAPPVPTVTLESPTPPSGAEITPALSSRSTFHSSSAPKQHQRTFSTPETAAEEKISRGRYSASSYVLDPVDIAMHKMVKELGFNEDAAKWALKCTDTGESLDVAAAINLLLKGGGHVDPLAMSATVTPGTGYMNSSSSVGGGIGDGNEGLIGTCMCRSKTMETSGEKEKDVWRPMWRWA
ncbi:F-box domain-containing protein [Histoplasma capsulatum G186AR]|uniref:F-box domain-containing protein n=2 Tax=Ajellomyces capsulatus TaxID=5037 RepID=C0NHL8_AJECG|nr:F-box domain-containing protein [Histoplasma capsulatum G186AR]EEH09303.1 F-box domain-containing protein [Histoplasma capsulatum G186AR]KAG5303356.1 F-box domain-containing protein [Histoplasma capsulatum]QSS68954.1 F-box domain-containing protein [Histoplasma capsulatum G186AR]